MTNKKLSFEELIRMVVKRYASIDEKSEEKLIATLWIYGYGGLKQTGKGDIIVTRSFKSCMEGWGAKCLWLMTDGDNVVGMFRRWTYEETYDDYELVPVDEIVYANVRGEIRIGEEEKRVE